MELVAYLHSEMMCERLQNGESIDQVLDCQLLETIVQSSRHAKSITCVGLAASLIAINATPIAAFAYSPDIASIQQLLARRGFNPGAIDGVNGPSTRDAIINAQAFYKLETDGVIGAKTLAALEADTYDGGSPSTKMTPISYSSSNDVVLVQQALSDRGFYKGAIDGIQGSRTTDAILAAQAFYKLKVDGIAGSQTLAALQADAYPAPATPQAVEVIYNNGNSSSSVKALQQLLSDRGFYKGAIDGIQGSRTTDAILAAQAFYKLKVDGVAGSQTLAALQSDGYKPEVLTPTPPNTVPVPIVVPPTVQASSNEIKNLQQLLSDRGFYGGAIDGVNGAMTKEAVTLAQKTYGLIADGVAGSVTLAALEADQGIGSQKNQVAGVTSGVNVATTPTPNSTIKQGQTLLNNLGFYNGPIDGVQSSQTTEAIKTAQAFYGLTVDGVLGSTTLAALQS